MADEVKKEECQICAMIERFNNYNTDPDVGQVCPSCPPEEEVLYDELYKKLRQVKGLDPKDAAVIANLKDKELREDLVNMILHVDNETNEMTRRGERIEWTSVNNQYGFYFDDNIKDCNGQTMTVNDVLTKQGLNYKWDIQEAVSLGHVWGIAKATNLPNQNQLYLTYDPRARSFGLNNRCKKCSGWIGETMGGVTGTDKVGTESLTDYINE